MRFEPPRRNAGTYKPRFCHELLTTLRQRCCTMQAPSRAANLAWPRVRRTPRDSLVGFCTPCWLCHLHIRGGLRIMGVCCDKPCGESCPLGDCLPGEQNGIFRAGVGVSRVSTAARSDSVPRLAAARPIHTLRCLPQPSFWAPDCRSPTVGVCIGKPARLVSAGRVQSAEAFGG